MQRKHLTAHQRVETLQQSLLHVNMGQMPSEAAFIHARELVKLMSLQQLEMLHGENDEQWRRSLLAEKLHRLDSGNMFKARQKSGDAQNAVHHERDAQLPKSTADERQVLNVDVRSGMTTDVEKSNLHSAVGTALHTSLENDSISSFHNHSNTHHSAHKSLSKGTAFTAVDDSDDTEIEDAEVTHTTHFSASVSMPASVDSTGPSSSRGTRSAPQGSARTQIYRPTMRAPYYRLKDDAERDSMTP